MGYKLAATSSLEALVDYLWAVQAGLEADDALQSEVAVWLALEERVLAERATRDAGRKALIKAAAVVRRKDVAWDGVVKRLGTRTFADSERNAKRPPYSILFGTLRPSDATRLGPVKAHDFGASLSLKVRALKVADYDALASELDTASAGLAGADTARKARKAESETHDIRRLALIDDIETQIDKTQIAILTAYPRQDDLVRAILSPAKDPTSPSRGETVAHESTAGDAPAEA